VLLLDAPAELGPVLRPPNVRVVRRLGTGPYDVIIAFCPDTRRLSARFETGLSRLGAAGALWICWPKKTSGVSTDLSDIVVRSWGLAAGLVDVKIAAIDATWSGLKFVRRVRDRGADRLPWSQ
jgi:hypothetical protein